MLRETPNKAAAKEPFVVMAKPVGPLCNMACDYCYYTQTGHLYDHTREFRMTPGLLETFIRQYIEAGPGPVVSFVWHGGEPTLAGLDFYKRALEIQQKYLPTGWKCWNNLQTNGLLLDDEWCAFLAEARFDVGLSIDGGQQTHDMYRKDRAGNGTYQQAAAAARRLQAYGVQPDLLCTVTSEATKDPLSVYRALQALNTGWIQFIPIVRLTPDGHVTPDSVTAEGYGTFLCRVFDEWAGRDVGHLMVQLFAEMTKVWSGGRAGLCWMAPTCGRALIVEHDGGVYACDHFVDPRHRLGHIENASLRDLADSPGQRDFGIGKQTRLPAVCRSCQWLAVCGGGCPKDRFALSGDGEPGMNCLCAGLRMFFAHAEQPLKEIIRLSAQKAAPAAIMDKLRADAEAKWRNVGRNDPCPCGSGRKAKHCCLGRRKSPGSDPMERNAKQQ
jgi:uncharacterized protein